MSKTDLTIQLPAIDVDTRKFTSEQEYVDNLRNGASMFIEHGFLIIRNAYSADFISKIHSEFAQEYSEYFVDKEFHDANTVGHKRKMVTLKIKDSINSPDFYANPRVFPLIEYLLGGDIILNGLGAVISLPGSEDQHIHRDYQNIYNNHLTNADGDAWIKKAPPYAITMGIPLIPMNEDTGHTRFWSGTHLNLSKPGDMQGETGVDYSANLGDCILFDYRVIHAGMGNKSKLVRPLIYNIYSAPWFRDSVNYNKQKSILVDKENYSKIPLEYRRLFDWSFTHEIRAEFNT